MADKAREWTDKKLKQMERRISDIYKKSAKDITKKWDEYMKKTEAELAPLQRAYDEAKKSGDDELIKKTGEKLSKAETEQTLQNERYKSMINETTRQLANVNQTALSYINGEVPDIYAKNYSQIGDEMGDMFHGIKVKTIVNEDVIKNLITEGDIKLPQKKLNIPKDMRWNTKQINSSVLQGILQGESMDKIAKRIKPIVSNNSAAAIRNTRTIVTGAENRGRNDSYKRLSDEGIVLKKVWIATGDDRTRQWHLDIDGQQVDPDESFTDGNGNKIKYPGDPSAAAETVYNCRCSMKTHVVGFRRADGSISKIDYEAEEESLHERQIREEQERRKKEESTTETHIVNGKDISGTWVRRPDQFDFEIDDVINAQGFDGLPRVVDAKEFDRYVQESKFIAQRTYSAPDQETLDMYRNELYNGKWYVDCSTGGARFGKGMYAAYNNGKEITEDINNAMQMYHREFAENRIETFTFAKDFRFISHEEALKLASIEQDKWSGRYGREYIMNELSPLIDKNFSEDEKAVIAKYFFHVGTDENISWFDELPEKERNILFNRMDATLGDAYMNLRHSVINEMTSLDAGTAAALHGYDAILDSRSGYAVVLNRTKVIFKGE